MEYVPLNFPFLAAVLLVGISLYIIIFKRNLIKLVMGVAILSSGINLFLVSLGYRAGGVAPIYTDVPEGTMVLPVPQALTLTNIVISVAVLALMLTLVIHIYRHTGDIDAKKSRILKG
ncbi:MAG: cation:proton antiporter subunit C [Dehalococcoidia bacterium]|jgi:multicomponent Na+:H+ antiporter subunit C